MTIELGILGAGNMAEAIAAGVVRNGILHAGQILAADPASERRELFTRRLGIRCVAENREAARAARMILLSVKPQQMKNVLGEIGPAADPRTLFISIAAGVSTRFIETHLGEDKPWRVIRTMPNTPMLVAEGMAAMARGKNASDADAVQAKALFEAAAEVIIVTEDKLDAVTAISGSGPAYVFYLVEQMIRAGTELGLTADESRKLAIQTAVGASKMLACSADTPRELRRKVTSPKGTTEAAVTFLDQHDAGETFVEAIKAAARRSKELGA